MIFSVYMNKCYKRDVAPLAKKQRHPCPKEIHLKVTFPAPLKKMMQWTLSLECQASTL